MSAKLITPPTVLAVTLADAKANMSIDGDHMDARVTIWLQGVIAALEHEIGQCMMSQTWTVTLDAFPSISYQFLEESRARRASDAISLPHPVISITSIKYHDVDNIERTLAPAAYRIKPEAYRTTVAPISGTSWPDTYDETGAVVVTCVCGYGETAAATPANVRLYVLAKLVSQFDPASSSGGTVGKPYNIEYLDRLLDACRTYA